jgi:NADH:ubiquinone oxidoreductase subunit 4 (subunit M)
VRADLSWTEGFALAPLVLALVLIGINPHALTTFDTTLYSVAATTQGASR